MTPDGGGAPDDLARMRLHAHALFTHDAAGRMLRVNEPNGAAAPRFFLGHTAAGDLLRFRADVSDATVRALTDAWRATPAGVLDPAPYEAVLARAAPVERVWSGPAFTFPDDLPSPAGTLPITAANADLLRAHLPQWLGDVGVSVPMYAVVADGHAVSVCASVRTTPHANEAGVETAPAYRGRGYAAAAAAAWALAIRAEGRVPLYSTSWDNAASRAVARTLRLHPFGSDLHID